MSVKKVINAARACIGNLEYDIDYHPDFSTWEIGNIGSYKFNCWTSLLFWAFQGGEIDKTYLLKYQKLSRIMNEMEKQGKGETFMAGIFDSMQAVNLMEHVTPVAGSAIIFQKTGSPMAHVALSDGNGNVISNDPYYFLGAPGTKLVPLKKFKGELLKSNIGFNSVKHTPEPFWTYLAV